MRLTVLGCAGTFPSATSPCSSYLVEQEGFRLLIDAGNGSVGALQRHAGLLDVDAVMISHLHADHCVDLVPYYYARRYHPEHPPALPVYGPRRLPERIGRVFDYTPGDGLSDTYDFRTLTEGVVEVGPFRVRTVQTNHPIECYAMRVEAGGKVLTYSADSAESDAVADAAREADLFLCEATWLDGPDYPSGVHMRARHAGQHAAKADVDRLVLIHTISYLDDDRALAEASEEWSGPVELAESGRSYDL
jgi:ribonuclease BN (tRNA processing enzyme)